MNSHHKKSHDIRMHNNHHHDISFHNTKFHIGKRIWKTSIAVLTCFFIHMLRSGQTFPFFSTITAILCMQPYIGKVGKIAADQLIGTFIGVFYGVIILCLFQFAFPNAGILPIMIVISLFIVPVIKTSVLIGKADMAHFICVVFLCMAMYLFQDGDPLTYVLDRILDTIIGIIVALTVNSLSVPRKRRKELLFVTALDDTLMDENNHLSSYSKIEINRMIDDGANFTVCTEQTPASLRDIFADIHLNLPVIAMNGAALYDIAHNKYIHKVPLHAETVEAINHILAATNAGCFYNTLIQDTMMIYFDDFKNMAMQEIYRELRTNPYRNFVCSRLPEHVNVLSLYIIDETPTIIRIMKDIRESPAGERIRLTTDEEGQYPGYSHIKIYAQEATRQNMITYLRQMIDAETSVTFGSKEGKYDFTITEDHEDRVVRIMRSLYRPVIWQKSYEEKMEKIKEKLKADEHKAK